MTSPAPLRPRHRREHGFTLVEILVGVVIAMIAVLVIYQVFAVSEGIKRTTTGVGDAQQTGLFTSFVLAQEITNAGSGVATAANELSTCPDTANPATTLRPYTALITDGGGNDIPDSLVVNYAVSSRIVVPALFTLAAAPGADFFVQTPNGVFVGDRIVAISQTGDCHTAVVSAVGVPDGTGVVQITYAPASGGVTYPSSSLMFNFGPATRAQRVRYDVAADSLRSLDLWNGAAVPVPIASNIVNIKYQYGIDTDNNGYLDTWVSATDVNWTPAQVLAAPPEKINQIKAIRMAIVVRSEQFDKTLGDFTPTALFTECGSAACPAPLAITVAKSIAPQGNYRFRVYENVVPIRNALWNYVPG